MKKTQIQIARESAGLSVNELARELKVTSQTVYNWEDRTTVPKANHISGICKVLKVKAKILIDDYKDVK